jgi:hypothetical protein
MRTTVTMDDALYEQALALADRFGVIYQPELH